jgi:hypothetical protein
MVTLSRSADIAFKTLLPEEQGPVGLSIKQLENFPQDSNLRDKIFKLGEGEGELYAMKATPQFDLIFQVLDEDKEILEIVPYKRIKFMFGNVEHP